MGTASKDACDAKFGEALFLKPRNPDGRFSLSLLLPCHTTGERSMSFLDNIILCTDSYKARPASLTPSPLLSPARRGPGTRCIFGHTAPPLSPQVSHYKQYPPGSEYVYSVRPPPGAARSSEHNPQQGASRLCV